MYVVYTTHTSKQLINVEQQIHPQHWQDRELCILLYNYTVAQYEAKMPHTTLNIVVMQWYACTCIHHSQN